MSKRSHCLFPLLWAVSWIDDVYDVVFICLAVKYVDCGRGAHVRFECSQPGDFGISVDGVVFALRPLLRSRSWTSPLLIKAQDEATQQQWQTQVRLLPARDHPAMVRHLHLRHSWNSDRVIWRSLLDCILVAVK